jgi:hypothetical protein
MTSHRIVKEYLTWSFPNNLSQQECELLIWSPLVSFLGKYSRSRFAQNSFDASSQSTITEIRNSKDVLWSVEGMHGQNLELGLVSDLDCGRECGSRNQRSRVFQALIGQNTYVFNVIALIDESDGGFDAPAGVPRTP